MSEEKPHPNRNKGFKLFVTSSGESANFLMEDLELVLQFLSTNYDLAENRIFPSPC